MTKNVIDELAGKSDKLEGRAEYLQGTGYDVTLKVSYTRVRRVRALNPEQAMEFARIREARYAPNYFHAQNHQHYTVDSIEAVETKSAPTKSNTKLVE